MFYVAWYWSDVVRGESRYILGLYTAVDGVFYVSWYWSDVVRGESRYILGYIQLSMVCVLCSLVLVRRSEG